MACRRLVPGVEWELSFWEIPCFSFKSFHEEPAHEPTHMLWMTFYSKHLNSELIALLDRPPICFWIAGKWKYIKMFVFIIHLKREFIYKFMWELNLPCYYYLLDLTLQAGAERRLGFSRTTVIWLHSHSGMLHSDHEKTQNTTGPHRTQQHRLHSLGLEAQATTSFSFLLPFHPYASKSNF